MLRIRPFAALRPHSDKVEAVASVPYDVVDTAEARALAKGIPESFLRVVRSEIELPEGADPYADEIYARAKSNLTSMVEGGTLQREDAPSLYLYRQEATLLGERVSQTGVVACCHVEDYEQERIKKHEKTRKKKEDDRTRHVLTTRAHAGPVFLLYEAQAEINALVEAASAGEPLYDFEAVDGVRHTVWRVSETDAWVESFGKLDAAYVADGHHRSASAARAARECATNNPQHRGDEDYNWFLTVLFPHDALTVLPYHRVVADLNGQSPAEVLEKLAGAGQFAPSDTPEPEARGSFGVYVDGAWFRLTLDPESIDRSDPVASLDYQLLSDRVLGPILGIGDLRQDERIGFVGGIRGTGELEKRVDGGRAAIAFALAPVSVKELMAVADAGRTMPPKSTWFEPKLRSGLLVSTF